MNAKCHVPNLKTKTDTSCRDILHLGCQKPTAEFITHTRELRARNRTEKRIHTLQFLSARRVLRETESDQTEGKGSKSDHSKVGQKRTAAAIYSVRWFMRRPATHSKRPAGADDRTRRQIHRARFDIRHISSSLFGAACESERRDRERGRKSTLVFALCTQWRERLLLLLREREAGIKLDARSLACLLAGTADTLQNNNSRADHRS
jgi:hypothetical protein